MKKDNQYPKPTGWRVSLSIVTGVGWLAFLLIWFFFYTDKYVWEKHVAIVLLSLLVLVGILGLPWLLWWQKNRTPKETEMWKMKGFKSRVWVSGIAVFAALIVLIYWFWFYGEPYFWYQNLIIFIVAVLIVGGTLGAMWAPWGMKHDKDFEKCECCDEEKKEE